MTEIPSGKGKISFEIDEKLVLGILRPSEATASSNPEVEVERALKNTFITSTIVSLRGKSVAIAVDDVTRTTPTHILLPPILRLLTDAGARRDDIKIIVALGTHRPMNCAEMKEKLGTEVVEEYEVVNHCFSNESKLEYLGKIADNVPVWINKAYLKANVRIATGNIIPHCNVGWSGGAKMLLPGLAGSETVGRMHIYSAITTPNALGMEENPTRQLIEAFADRVGIHFIVNTVLTMHGKIAGVFAGHFIEAHRKGVEFAKQIYVTRSPGMSDITISSSYPASVDYWQGTKGLFSADLTTKLGGGIVSVAPCYEGFSNTHPKWIEYLQHNAAELREMCEKPGKDEDLTALGVALSTATVMERHLTCLVSDGVSEKEAQEARFHKSDSIEEALAFLTNEFGRDPRILVLTHGGDTLPMLS